MSLINLSFFESHRRLPAVDTSMIPLWLALAHPFKITSTLCSNNNILLLRQIDICQSLTKIISIISTIDFIIIFVFLLYISKYNNFFIVYSHAFLPLTFLSLFLLSKFFTFSIYEDNK